MPDVWSVGHPITDTYLTIAFTKMAVSRMFLPPPLHFFLRTPMSLTPDKKRLQMPFQEKTIQEQFEISVTKTTTEVCTRLNILSHTRVQAEN